VTDFPELPDPKPNLYERARRRFGSLGGVDLELPKRESGSGPPAWLQEIWEQASKDGRDKLTQEEINTEITAVRSSTRGKRHE